MRILLFIINMLVVFILRFHFDSLIAVVAWTLGVVYGVIYTVFFDDD